MTIKDAVRFPLKIQIEKNKEIDDVVHKLNMQSISKISKHQFIMEAIEEKIAKQRRNDDVAIRN